MGRMGFRFLGNLHIVVVGERDPAPLDWNAYVAAIQAEAQRGVDLAQMRTLVFSDGGGPNAAQRKVTHDLREGWRQRQAIVTVSRLVRGVITAQRWFKPHRRAFAPSELQAALEFLGVPATSADLVLGLANETRLGQGVSAVKSLELSGSRR